LVKLQYHLYGEVRGKSAAGIEVPNVFWRCSFSTGVFVCGCKDTSYRSSWGGIGRFSEEEDTRRREILRLHRHRKIIPAWNRVQLGFGT
jgi:hypothetical protein